MNKDRFDLEEEIMRCWEVVDDIKLAEEKIKELNLPSTQHIETLLEAIRNLYSIRFNTLNNTFGDLVFYGKIT
jgi:plasmid maintenance system killer protein